MTTPITNMPPMLPPMPPAFLGTSLPRLGRKKAADPRDRGYLALDRIRGIASIRSVDGLEVGTPLAGLPRLYRYHKRGPQLDQGQTSRCVVYALGQLIQSGPIMQDFSKSVLFWEDNYSADADKFLGTMYTIAQMNDEWDGEEPTYYGTSGRAGAKAFQKLGFFGNYYWLTTVEEIARYIILYGPVPVGTDWFTDMDMPDHGGYIRPAGTWRGGHEWLIDGVNIVKRIFHMRNSWGKWGVQGGATVTFEDMEYLLSLGGDALAVPEIRLPAKKTKAQPQGQIITAGSPHWRIA